MNGFLQSKNGDKSSSRLIGLVVVASALIFVQEILWIGREDVVSAATAAAIIFAAVAGTAMTFLFGQKKTEETGNTKDLNKNHPS